MSAEQREEGSEPTEQPSARQREKVLQEGQVSRSRDLMIAMQLLAFFLLIGNTYSLEAVVAVLSVLDRVSSPFNSAITASPPEYLTESLQKAFAVFPDLLVPVVLVILMSAIAGALISGPFIFSVKVIAPKARRINPMEGLKRIFSMQGLLLVVMAFLKILLLFAALIGVMGFLRRDIMGLSTYTVSVAILKALLLLLWMGFSLTLVLLLIAAVDVVWQKHRFQRQLLLTRQQAKDTLKNEEGAPEIRQRIRQARQKQAALSRKKMLDAVPSADLILTNPIHYAVALQYRPDSKRAPVLVAKGVDHLAELITSLGRSAGKPVLIQPMLTRALYYHTEPGQEIDPDLYHAVAKVMVYLYQLDRYRTRQSKFCPAKPNIEVPEKYQHHPEQ